MTSALVLGGGGVTGIGWEVGLLHGLAERGLNLTDADVVIGTSAGSVVGTQVTGPAGLPELYADQLEPPDAEIGARFGTGTMLRMILPWAIPGSPMTKRRRIGRAALRAHPEPSDARLEVIRSRIGVTTWPERDLRVTALNAHTGASRVFDPNSGVDIVRAVAASCALPLVWPPVPIDGVPYVDGGMRSTTNADLATGADRVVVVAPLPRSTARYHAIGAQLARIGPDVRAAVVSPDRDAVAAIGKNMLDPARRADAARAGLRQAGAVLDAVAAAWRD